MVFSGDVGRQNDVIIRPPEPIQKADVLVCESTYGDRLHAESDPESELAEIITKTAGRGGIVLVPSFAVVCRRARTDAFVSHPQDHGGRPDTQDAGVPEQPHGNKSHGDLLPAVLHHLKTLLPNPRNSLVFAGFQAPGTRGGALVNGADSVKIHGDYNEILQWLKAGALKPEKVYVTHGELVASDVMRKRIQEKFDWNTEAPELFDEAEI